MKKFKLKDKLVFEWYNEYEQIDWTKRWNWITITIIHWYFEYEHYGYHMQFVLFGVGFYFRYNTDKAMRLFAKWEREAKKTDWGKILSSQEEFDKHIKKNGR